MTRLARSYLLFLTLFEVKAFLFFTALHKQFETLQAPASRVSLVESDLLSENWTKKKFLQREKGHGYKDLDQVWTESRDLTVLDAGLDNLLLRL